MEKIISRYLEDYLSSISYKLTDREKAYLILNNPNMFEQREYLLKLANETEDIKLATEIYGRYQLKDYARVLFGVNDGKYVYLLTEDKDEILGIFQYVEAALDF